MTGYGNNKFGPNDNIIFAQLAKIMSNAGSNNSTYENLNIDHWANDAISWCVANDLFIPSSLQENGSYSVNKLNAPMTRYIVCLNLHQLLKIKQQMDNK